MIFPDPQHSHLDCDFNFFALLNGVTQDIQLCFLFTQEAGGRGDPWICWWGAGSAHSRLRRGAGQNLPMIKYSVADPGPRDPVPFWPQAPGSGSEMNNNIPDHISESLETIFRLKILKSLMRIRDPESFWPWIRDGKIRIRDKHPGSATVIKW